MISISILALRNAVPSSVADAGYVFSMVNEFLRQAGKEPLFEVRLVGLSPEVSLNGGRHYLRPDVLMEAAPPSDLIIIPSMSGDMMGSTYPNIPFAPWIAEQYRNGTA